MHWARTAPWPLPGDGLSHPEQDSPQRMVPETGTTAQALGPGDGLSHPEQEGQQRMVPETGTAAAARRYKE